MPSLVGTPFAGWVNANPGSVAYSPTNGNRLVVIVSGNDVTPPTVTDDASGGSNTYTHRGSIQLASQYYHIFDSAVIAGSPTLITPSFGISMFSFVYVLEFSNLGAFDNAAQGDSGGFTTSPSASATAAAASSLGIFVLDLGGNTRTITGPAGWLPSGGGLEANPGDNVAYYDEDLGPAGVKTCNPSLDSGTNPHDFLAIWADASAPAPVLSAPSADDLQETSVDLNANSDTGDGTLYWFISASPTPPADGLDLKAGVGAVSFGNQPVTADGAQLVDDAGGLSAGQFYYAHMLQTNAAAVDSNIVTTAQFQTASPPSRTATPADLSPTPGQTISVALTGFSGAPTGATVNAVSATIQNALQGSVDVVIPALADFEGGQPHATTRWQTAIDLVISEAGGSATVSIQIDPPGGDSWFGQAAAAPYPSDTFFPPETVFGDDYFFEQLSGDFLTVLTSGVAPLDAPPPASMGVRIFDVTLGQWSAIAVHSLVVADIDAPVLLNATINAAGTQLTLTSDEDVVLGADGADAGLVIAMSGGAITASYLSGAGSPNLVYNLSRVVIGAETGTIDYTQPGDGIQDDASQPNLLASLAGFSVVNGSTTIPAASGVIYGDGDLTVAGAFAVDAMSASGSISSDDAALPAVASELVGAVSFSGRIEGDGALPAAVAPNIDVAGVQLEGSSEELRGSIAPWRSLVTLRDEDDCPYTDFLPYLLPSLPGAPQALVLQQIGEVLEDFLEHGRQWLFTTAPINLRVDQEVYELPIPVDATVVQFEQVMLRGIEIHPVDQADMLVRVPMRGYQRFENRILISPMPKRDEVGALQVHLSLKPQAGRVNTTKSIFNNWREIICAGVMARMKSMPDRKWSDAIGAETHDNKYLVGRNKAEADRRSLHDGKPYRMSGVNIFRNRRRNPTTHF